MAPANEETVSLDDGIVFEIYLLQQLMPRLWKTRDQMTESVGDIG